MSLPISKYHALQDIRVQEPKALQRALKKRARRSIPGKDGHLMLLTPHAACSLWALTS